MNFTSAVCKVLSTGAAIALLSCKSVDQSGKFLGEDSPSKCSTYENPDLPKIYNCSELKDRHAIEDLVRQAKGGLGFPEREGPRNGDIIYINNYYMAWVDNTGYSGKMNGLWTLAYLNGALNFTLTEPTVSGNRAISMLLPGEDGDGRWGNAYNGAEHYEMPRYKKGKHSAQAGIREANHFASNAPSTWTQCINANNDLSRWDNSVGETSVDLNSDGLLQVRNVAQLRIVMRINKDSFKCGSLFPLENGKEADIRLAAGYAFSPNSPQIERSYQLLNYSKDELRTEGIKKLIGGQLLTDWPKPHYLKQFQKWIKWNDDGIAQNNPEPYDGKDQKEDIIKVRGSGSMTLNALADSPAGRTIAMFQAVTPNAGEDLGYCLCKAHGGFEFTGSVLAGQNIAAARDGVPTKGPIQKRMIVLGGNRDGSLSSDITSTQLRAAELDPSNHELGRAEGDEWIENTGKNHGNGGFLIFKRYVNIPEKRAGQAIFNLKIDIVNASNDDVAEIDLVWNGKDVLAKKTLKRSDFFRDNTFQRFVLDFESPSEGNIEPRIRWLNKAAMAFNNVSINSVSP